jgi:hypothetical protein
MRIATFNLENLDDETGQDPSMATRVALMRPQLERITADILCLQEARGSHGARRAAGAGARRRRTPPAQRTPGRTQQPAVEDGHLYRDHPLPSRHQVPQRDQPHWTAGGGQGRAHRRAAQPAPLLCAPRSRSSRATAPATNGSTMASSTPTRPSAATSATAPSTRPSNRSGHGGRIQETDSLDPSRSPGADHDSACSPSGQR